jgi:hypothetical protein
MSQGDLVPNAPALNQRAEKPEDDQSDQPSLSSRVVAQAYAAGVIGVLSAATIGWLLLLGWLTTRFI